MTVSCLDPKYSTTRRVSKARPVIENKPEDKFETVLFLPEGEGRQGEGGLRTQGYFKKSEPDKPLITVITVVFNGEQFLEETILSVINQTYDNVEYIIIDGGSTDGTLDIIKKYEERIDYWVSERDEGIYGAMNKGGWLSLGIFIAYVNADDFLYKTTLQALVNEYTQLDFDYSFGPVDIYEANKLRGTVYPEQNAHYCLGEYLRMPTPHQSFFVKGALFRMSGGFDQTFKLRADYDLILRVMMISDKKWYFEHAVGGFRLGGASGSYRTFIESFKLLKQHGVGSAKVTIVTLASLLKLCISKILAGWMVDRIRTFRNPTRFQRSVKDDHK